MPLWTLECQNARRLRRVFERAFWKNKSKFMQHVNLLMKSMVLKEKSIKEKPANHEGNARATYNVVNKLLDKFSTKNHPPITSRLMHKHVQPISGRVDVASATETADSVPIPGWVKPKTVKTGIHSLPA